MVTVNASGIGQARQESMAGGAKVNPNQHHVLIAEGTARRRAVD